jgi:hypothetical protein
MTNARLYELSTCHTVAGKELDIETKWYATTMKLSGIKMIVLLFLPVLVQREISLSDANNVNTRGIYIDLVNIYQWNRVHVGSGQRQTRVR